MAKMLFGLVIAVASFATSAAGPPTVVDERAAAPIAAAEDQQLAPLAADANVTPGGPFRYWEGQAKAYLANKIVDFSAARSLPYQLPTWTAFENVRVDNDRFAVLMQQDNVKYEPLALYKLPAAQIARVEPGRMQVDGVGTDWDGIAPMAGDPANDDGALYSGVSGTDLANVYMAHDGTDLYIRMTMHDGGPLLQALYVVVLKQYFLTNHTPWDGFIACFNNGGGWEVFDGNVGHPPSYYYGWGHGAAGDGWIEFKVPLADMLIPDPMQPIRPAGPVDRGIEHRFVHAYIHPGPHPNPPPVSDALARSSWSLIVGFYD